MINFEKWESQVDSLARSFVSAKPFELVVLDGFCDERKLNEMYDQIPSPGEANINKSRDYIFAKNKYEKSNFKEISPQFQELYGELTSERFGTMLSNIVGQKVFVDPEFHGGGIHQGGPGSFLDMHVDFNFHPLNRTWFRNLNILLYLNRGWKPEYRGQLKLRHRDHPESTVEIEPLFNRCVIMFTRDYTVHGYDQINFPDGMFRRSVAAYAYSLAEEKDKDVQERTTVWYPEQGGTAKKTIGKHWPTLVRIKNSLFGSATAKNK